MDNEEKCMVSGSMAMLLRLASLTGCTSLKLQPLGTTYYIARITKPKYRLNSIFLFMLTFSVIFSIMSLYKYVKVDSTIEKLEMKTFIFLCVDVMTKIFITIVVKHNELRRMKRFIQYYESIKSVRKTLNKMHKGNDYDQTSTKNYEYVFKIILTLVGILYIGWIILIILFVLFNKLEEFNVLLSYLYIVETTFDVYMFLITSQILLMITIVYSALLELNHALAELLFALDTTDNINSLQSWKYFGIFYELTDSYVIILDTVRKIKRNEGGAFLLLLTNACFNLFVMGYSSLFFITNDSDPFDYALLIISVIILTMKFLLTVDPCHRTQQQVEDTKVIIGTLISRMSSNYTFSHDLKQFSKQLLFQPTAYSVLNVCNIKRSLIIKVMATIVTNLVGIVQI